MVPEVRQTRRSFQEPLEGFRGLEIGAYVRFVMGFSALCKVA